LAIPLESEELATIDLQLEELQLTATIFRTPQGDVAVYIDLPYGCSLATFAAAQANTRIGSKAMEVAGKAPDYYELRYRAPT
jgi:hypothetical protein